MRPNHMNYKHKQNERRKRAEEKQSKVQRLAELEEKYKIALENSNNVALVNQYNHFIAIQKEYETFEFKDGFNGKKAAHEAAMVVAEMREKYYGVDKRDLDSLKFQINLLKKVVSSQAPENEPEM